MTMMIDKRLERVFFALTKASGWITNHGLTVHHLPDGRWRFKSWIGECILPAHLPVSEAAIRAGLDVDHDAIESYVAYLVTLIQCICEDVHELIRRAGP